MSKLPTDLSYIKRCGYCGNEQRYIMRASNVNTGITDDNAITQAQQRIGCDNVETCESCGMYTQHVIVAFDFRKAQS